MFWPLIKSIELINATLFPPPKTHLVWVVCEQPSSHCYLYVYVYFVLTYVTSVLRILYVPYLHSS